MEFKQWMEAKFDPAATQLYKWNWDGKPRLGRSFNLKIDAHGSVVHADPSDGGYFVLEPGARKIQCQRISPLSPDFHKLVKALKSKHGDIERWDVEVFGQAGHMETGNGEWNRTVGYWLRQGAVNLNNRIPTLYHGTTTNLLPEIMRQGLLPRGLTGNTGSYGAQNIGSLSQHNLVYVSVHPDAATRTAAIQAARKHGGRPVILKIDGSQLFPERFVPDEDARHATDAQASVRSMAVAAYQGRIPAGIIKPFLLGQETHEGGRIRTHWEPYTPVPMGEHPWTAKLRQGDVPYSQDPEYYIFRHAGIIDDQEVKDPSGWSHTRTVAKRVPDNDEVVSLLKNGGWANTVRALQQDMGRGYSGVLHRLKDLRVPKNLPPQLKQTVDVLARSGLIDIQDDGSIYLRTWKVDQQLINLARLLGNRTDAGTFLQNVQAVVQHAEAQRDVA